MSGSDSIIFFIVVALIVVVIEFFTIKGHKNLIRESLEKRGAKVIKMSWEPFDFDKSNHTYWVEYEDSKGELTSR